MGEPRPNEDLLVEGKEEKGEETFLSSVGGKQRALTQMTRFCIAYHDRRLVLQFDQAKLVFQAPLVKALVRPYFSEHSKVLLTVLAGAHTQDHGAHILIC